MKTVGKIQYHFHSLAGDYAQSYNDRCDKRFTTLTVKNGKLAKLEVASTPNGGVMGIRSQPGVNMPGM